MKWTAEAEAAMRNIHSAGLERVRERAEKLARAAGRVEVGPADVASAGGPSERGTPPVLRGYRIDTCFGARGCPNPVVASGGMVERIEALLDGENLLGFLERRVNGPIRHHHEFRVAVADCPNACSQPQIRDVGVIGACTPRVVDAECSRCTACVAACPEGAVLLGADPDDPRVDGTRCLH